MEQVIIASCFAGFLAFFLFVGWYIGKISEKNEEAYVTGGRSFGRYMTGLSAGAASTSGFIMVGAVGAGYLQGVSAFIFPLGWLVGDLVFWSFFPGKINQMVRDYNSYTVPDLISAPYKAGGRSTYVRSIAALALIVFVSVFAGTQLLAAGKTVATIFDTRLGVGIIISGIVIMLYCFRGGLTASIWINFFQAIMMIFTTVGMLALALMNEGSLVEIFHQIKEIDPTLIQIDGFYGQLGAVFAFIGFAAAAFGFDFSTPQFIVRIAACKSPEEARNTKWIYIGFMQLTWISMVLFGMILRVALPDLGDPETGLPAFANSLLPPWLIGIVMAGVFSSIASTVDSQMLVISNAMTMDLVPKLHKLLFDKFGMYFQYATTLFVGIFLITLSTTFTSSVYALLQFAGSAIGGAFAPAILIAIMNWRTNSMAIIMTMLAGSLASVTWELMGLNVYMLSTMPSMVISLVVHKIIMMNLRTHRPFVGGIASDNINSKR